MKLIRPFLKIAALASAVVLVAAFVSYRAGAFDWLSPSSPPSQDVVLDPGAFSVSPPSMLSGSKSAILAEPLVAVPAQPAPAPAQPSTTLMGGSKTLSVGPLVQPPATANTPTAQPPVQRQQSATPAAQPPAHGQQSAIP